MTEHTVDVDKLDTYLLSTIRGEDVPWVASATIASDTMLEITVEVPTVLGATAHELLDIFGLKGVGPVHAIRMGTDHAEVDRHVYDADNNFTVITDRYEYK